MYVILHHTLQNDNLCRFTYLQGGKKQLVFNHFNNNLLNNNIYNNDVEELIMP